MSRETNYYNNVRAANRQIWDGINALVALQREYNTLALAADTGSSASDGITKLELGAVVFDTANAFQTLLGQGHATNMAKLL